MKSIQTYIESGILEMYVMGATSAAESREVEQMAATHSEIRRELEAISQTMEAYAVAHAVKPKETIKPLLLATIDYMERLKKGEPAEDPPVLTQASHVTDYAAWLNRPDMVLPVNPAAIYVKLIGATPAATTAIVWLSGTADNEIHHDEYERFLIVEGSCDITVGDHVHHLFPGDYFAIPLHLPHTVNVTSDIYCKVILQRIAA